MRKQIPFDFMLFVDETKLIRFFNLIYFLLIISNHAYWFFTKWSH